MTPVVGQFYTLVYNPDLMLRVFVVGYQRRSRSSDRGNVNLFVSSLSDEVDAVIYETDGLSGNHHVVLSSWSRLAFDDLGEDWWAERVGSHPRTTAMKRTLLGPSEPLTRDGVPVPMSQFNKGKDGSMGRLPPDVEAWAAREREQVPRRAQRAVADQVRLYGREPKGGREARESYLLEREWASYRFKLAKKRDQAHYDSSTDMDGWREQLAIHEWLYHVTSFSTLTALRSSGVLRGMSRDLHFTTVEGLPQWHTYVHGRVNSHDYNHGLSTSRVERRTIVLRVRRTDLRERLLRLDEIGTEDSRLFMARRRRSGVGDPAVAVTYAWQVPIKDLRWARLENVEIEGELGDEFSRKGHRTRSPRIETEIRGPWLRVDRSSPRPVPGQVVLMTYGTGVSCPVQVNSVDEEGTVYVEDLALGREAGQISRDDWQAMVRRFPGWKVFNTWQDAGEGCRLVPRGQR